MSADRSEKKQERGSTYVIKLAATAWKKHAINVFNALTYAPSLAHKARKPVNSASAAKKSATR